MLLLEPRKPRMIKLMIYAFLDDAVDSVSRQTKFELDTGVFWQLLQLDVNCLG